MNIPSNPEALKRHADYINSYIDIINYAINTKIYNGEMCKAWLDICIMGRLMLREYDMCDEWHELNSAHSMMYTLLMRYISNAMNPLLSKDV